MELLADRFRVHDGRVMDLTTGAPVRFSLDGPSRRAEAQKRSALCDRLASVRHPLLLPLVDYGLWRDRWFEAHAVLPALRAPGDASDGALHLVRFLRDAGIELTARDAARHVRAATNGASDGWRPVGVRLQWRASIDSVRAVLEATGPPGVTALTIRGVPGSGLRTAYAQIARAARLAGFLVVSAGCLGALPASALSRHVCVLDWAWMMTRMPAALARGSPAGLRRLWIRFVREGIRPGASVDLAPLSLSELTAMVYPDIECGPSPAEIRDAAIASRGLPGSLVAVLARPNPSRRVMWVHELAAEYVVPQPGSQDVGSAKPEPLTAGIARLQRAVDAARALADRGRHARAERVLRRSIAALTARGARDRAAAAYCALGEILLDRAQPRAARDAFEQASQMASHPDVRILLGLARACRDDGRLGDAEGACRTALLAASEPAPQAQVRDVLAEIFWLRGRLDAAEETLMSGSAPLTAANAARLSAIRLSGGDVAGAGRFAAQAIRDGDAADPATRAAAHAASAAVYAEVGDAGGVRREMGAARTWARAARRPGLRVRMAAEEIARLSLCGEGVPRARRDRLLRAAQHVSPLDAARVRGALDPDGAELQQFVVSSGAVMLTESTPRPNDLIPRFQALLDAIHNTPDDHAALGAIASDLLASLNACSVVIRSARLGRVVAVAGRPWPGERDLSETVLNGGAAVWRAGATPETGEPVRAGASTIGTIVVRWAAETHATRPRATELLRIAATAAAPVMRTIADTAPPDPAGAYPDDLLGRGPAAERLRESIRRAALAPFPVLIEGESGAGKELVARAVHARSARRVRRFCAVNCAALTDDLLEAELFGHARGAFTGAIAERAGLFEEADEGTLFLDEVAELSARAQAKLLRVVQEGEVRRIGENLSRRVDTRIVAASNRSLEQDASVGRFRDDLRFRLDVIRIRIPPLRERADEIPWLAERIWTEAASRVGTRAALAPDLVAALARYDWPGNVRELQNVLASIAVHAPRRGRVDASILPAHIARTANAAARGFDAARSEFERRFIRAALARAGGRRAAAAAELGVSRQGLAKIIKRLGLES